MSHTYTRTGERVIVRESSPSLDWANGPRPRLWLAPYTWNWASATADLNRRERVDVGAGRLGNHRSLAWLVAGVQRAASSSSRIARAVSPVFAGRPGSTSPDRGELGD